MIGWPLSAALAITGLGAGLFTTPVFTAALHRVRPVEAGSAAGLLNAVQQLGGAVGVALLATVLLHRLSTIPPDAAAGSAFWASLALIAAAAAAAAFMKTRD
ncbi:hypothetical protein [Kribbella sp. CA-294648]|uniref:hypothetical protein n=1 Tax=Kribbella sp. CA-294648 TaxID=3239948 RepID=UPI003D8D4993